MRKTILLLATLAGIVIVTTSSVTDTNGLCDSPVVGGHTGAPGSPDCTYCHGGTPNTGTGYAEFDIGGEITQYVPGQTYECTVTVSQDSLDKYGFVVTARKSTNASSGDFVLIDTVNTRKFTESSKKYFSHTPCGADAIVAGSRTWSFQWTAPATDDGIITFYLSSLASNHDHTLAGDYSYTLTKTLDFATDIQEVDDDFEIQIFPNPSHDDLLVSLNKEWMNARITLIYPDGKPTGLVSSVPETGKIIISRNTWNLKSGVYFLKIESASGSSTKKIVLL